MNSPERGEVWLVDLGMTAKVRPCVVISVPVDDTDRALVALIPHTTSTRTTRFEAVVPLHFLKAGAFDAQGIVTVSDRYAIRRLGKLRPEQLQVVESALCRWLGLSCD